MRSPAQGQLTDLAAGSRLADLSRRGVSVWLDDLSRARITSGRLQEALDKYSVVGVTTNPTIFANALQDSSAYAQQVEDLKASGMTPDDAHAAAFKIITNDVAAAADLLLPEAERTDGADGRVSIEVDPTLAHDADATVALARDLWREIGRENIHIKIPATATGLTAITQAIAHGLSVNVTVLFDPNRYRQVAEAYVDGLERALAAGHDLKKIHSVASVFVSRIEAEVDMRLAQIGTPEALQLRGEAALAVSRECYAVHTEVFSGPRWDALAANGANVQRPLWASTSARSDEYGPTRYLSGLIAEGTVATLTEDTLLAFEREGSTEAPFTAYDYRTAARDVLARLSAVGVDYSEVAVSLEEAALGRFNDSWAELLSTVRAALR